MNSKLEAVLRVVGDLERFDAGAASSPNGEWSRAEDELTVSELDWVSAASRQPHLPDGLKKEDP